MRVCRAGQQLRRCLPRPLRSLAPLPHPVVPVEPEPRQVVGAAMAIRAEVGPQPTGAFSTTELARTAPAASAAIARHARSYPRRSRCRTADSSAQCRGSLAARPRAASRRRSHSGATPHAVAIGPSSSSIARAKAGSSARWFFSNRAIGPSRCGHDGTGASRSPRMKSDHTRRSAGQGQLLPLTRREARGGAGTGAGARDRIGWRGGDEGRRRSGQVGFLRVAAVAWNPIASRAEAGT